MHKDEKIGENRKKRMKINEEKKDYLKPVLQ